MALNIADRAADLPLELRYQIYSDAFDLDLGPLVSIHKRREWLGRTELPPLEICLESEGYRAYRQKANLHNHNVWPNYLEEAFFKGIEIAGPRSRKKKAGKGQREEISEIIFVLTGVKRHRKQVSSHIQVLKAVLDELMVDANRPWGPFGCFSSRLLALSGHKQQDYLYARLDTCTRGVPLRLGYDIQALEALLLTCRQSYTAAITIIELWVPPSELMQYAQKLSNLLSQDTLPKLQTLCIELKPSPEGVWPSSPPGPTWSKQHFLDVVEQTRATCVLEVDAVIVNYGIDDYDDGWNWAFSPNRMSQRGWHQIAPWKYRFVVHDKPTLPSPIMSQIPVSID